jgi:hypothetical protein
VFHQVSSGLKLLILRLRRIARFRGVSLNRYISTTVGSDRSTFHQLACNRQILGVRYVVTPLHAIRFVAADLHPHDLRHPSAAHVPNGGSPEIMEL